MPSPDELVGFHACDACGQRSLEAWYRKSDGRDFTFCGHHGRAHQIGLYAAGYRLITVAKTDTGSRLQGAP